MARIPKGIMGPIIGKVGPLVGATWKKKAYVRTVPKKKKKKKVIKSPAKHASEQTFKFMHNWLVPFHDYISIGFKNEAQQMTEINAAFSLNYKQAIVGAYPDLSIDYTKVVISRGDLHGLDDVELELVDDTLEVQWSEYNTKKTGYNDQVLFVVYEPLEHITDGFIGRAIRSDGAFSFALKDYMIGKTVHVFIGVVSLNRKYISNSQYFGPIQS